MSRVLSAVFDSTDMAEFAMMRLKREGIAIDSYEVAPLASAGQEDEFSPIVFAYGIQPGAQNAPFASDMFRAQPFGGVLYAFENQTGAEGRNDLEDRIQKDVQTESVRMRISMPEGELRRAAGIVRSCHGSRVRTI